MRSRPSSGWSFGGSEGAPWLDWVLFSGCLLQGFLRPGSCVQETRSGAMSRLGSVQRKMPCVFVTEVKAEPSAKREHQPFKVLATETLSEKALEADVYNAIATEKVDGTCCYVTNHKGQPYLWARLDRKPNKQAEKRFKKFLHSKENSKAHLWNTEEDFRPVPECWVPAKEVERQNGKPVPDENGHIPGWVPVEKNSKQYCWHSSVVNYEFGIALVLRHNPDEPGLLEISAVPLSELLEQTLELIGTNINGNPYGLGSKRYPLHFLIPHGAFQVENLPTLKHNDLLSWFEECSEGKIEGIVWHCGDGCLIKENSYSNGEDRQRYVRRTAMTFNENKSNIRQTLTLYLQRAPKVHRHHLGLCWPLPDTYMNSKPVIINMNLNKYGYAFDKECLFSQFSKIDRQKFDRLKDIIFDV